MSRAWFLGILAFALIVGGLSTLHGEVLALVIPILLYWGHAVLRSPDEVKLDVRRAVLPERVAPGEPVRVSVLVQNMGPGIEELVLQDAVPPALAVVDGSSFHMISLKKGARFSFEYSVRGQRGMYSFDALRATGADGLGLLRHEVRASAPAHCLVIPSILRIKAFPIRPRRTRVYAGTIPARVAGPGVEFFGVRPYVQGVATRRINWRAVARHPESLFCTEFQQERVADVAIILDARERTNLRSSRGELFERSVVAAGSLADALLQQGNRVGLLVYSHYLQWTFPGYGRIQRERILHALAQARTGASQVFEGLQYLPTRLFPAESQIVLVTPLLDADVSTIVQMRARGHRVLVIVPDPVEFESAGLPERRSRYSAQEAQLAARVVRLERRVGLGRLRRGGVQVVEWNVSTRFDLAMGVATRQFRQWRGPV